MNNLHSVFPWILEASLRASLLALAVLAVQFALRRTISARWRYALWLPVLAVLGIPVLPQSRWSAESVVVARVSPATAAVGAVLSGNAGEVALPAKHLASLDWRTAAAAIWLVGALLVFSFGMVSYQRARGRFERNAVAAEDAILRRVRATCAEIRLRAAPRVVVSPAVKSPAVAGVLRAVLLLPADFARAFTEPEANLVLRHELMHIKRHDLPMNAVLCALSALHWFNPVLWFAAWRARQDRESACDAAVLGWGERDCRREYGQALLKVQTACFPCGIGMGFVGIFERGQALRSRITAIARFHRSGPASGVLAAAAIVILGMLGATHAQVTKEAPANRASHKPSGPFFVIGMEILEASVADGQPMKIKGVTLAPSEGSASFTEHEFADFVKASKGLDMLSAPKITMQCSTKGEVAIGKEYVLGSGPDPVFIGFKCVLEPEAANGGIQVNFFVKQTGLCDRKTGAQIPIPKSGPSQELLASADVWTKTCSGTFDSAPDKVFVAGGNIAEGRQLLFAINVKEYSVPAHAKDVKAELEKTILPELKFDNVCLSEALLILENQSRTYSKDPEHGGVNVRRVISVGGTSETIERPITAHFRNIPLGKAFEYVAQAAGLTMEIAPDAVVICAKPTAKPSAEDAHAR